MSAVNNHTNGYTYGAIGFGICLLAVAAIATAHFGFDKIGVLPKFHTFWSGTLAKGLTIGVPAVALGIEVVLIVCAVRTHRQAKRRAFMEWMARQPERLDGLTAQANVASAGSATASQDEKSARADDTPPPPPPEDEGEPRPHAAYAAAPWGAQPPLEDSDLVSGHDASAWPSLPPDGAAGALTEPLGDAPPLQALVTPSGEDLTDEREEQARFESLIGVVEANDLLDWRKSAEIRALPYAYQRLDALDEALRALGSDFLTKNPQERLHLVINAPLEFLEHLNQLGIDFHPLHMEHIASRKNEGWIERLNYLDSLNLTLPNDLFAQARLDLRKHDYALRDWLVEHYPDLAKAQGLT